MLVLKSSGFCLWPVCSPSIIDLSHLSELWLHAGKQSVKRATHGAKIQYLNPSALVSQLFIMSKVRLPVK